MDESGQDCVPTGAVTSSPRPPLAPTGGGDARRGARRHTGDLGCQVPVLGIASNPPGPRAARVAR